jgi:hypothetical protein
MVISIWGPNIGGKEETAIDVIIKALHDSMQVKKTKSELGIINDAINSLSSEAMRYHSLAQLNKKIY